MLLVTKPRTTIWDTYCKKWMAIHLWARLLVPAIVRLVLGTGFAHEDVRMNQSFYVQDLGCIIIGKNAWKVCHICLILTYLAFTAFVKAF